MCNCLIVLKPMIKEYGGKFLGSFFLSSSSEKYGKSGSRMSAGLGSKNRWKQNSYPLGSIDKGTTHDIHNASKNSDENILVTSSYTVTETNMRDGAGTRDKDFETESQEDIIKRVKQYSR